MVVCPDKNIRGKQRLFNKFLAVAPLPVGLLQWKKRFQSLPLPAVHISQEVPQSVNNKGIYEFLDELANNHIIEINSVVKPYSRLFISKRLKEAEEKKDQLNPRQQKELDFYLMDFGKELK